jgi:hypothetical protein
MIFAGAKEQIASSLATNDKYDILNVLVNTTILW